MSLILKLDSMRNTFQSMYTCIQCGTKYCSTKCLHTHKETRFVFFGKFFRENFISYYLFHQMLKVPQMDCLMFENKNDTFNNN